MNAAPGPDPCRIVDGDPARATGSKVSIVGASGKLGRYMVQHSLDRGDDVVAVCRDKSVGKLAEFGDQITIVAGATDDRDVIRGAVNGCDGVLVVLVPRGVHGYATASQESARAGHSEHQLGTALDFRSHGGAAPWTYWDWGKTRAGAWLRTNAWQFGFVMSYPKGESAVTCYAYEPWHYRYVGRARTAIIQSSGLTLREFLWAEQTTPPPPPNPTPQPVATPEPVPSVQP